MPRRPLDVVALVLLPGMDGTGELFAEFLETLGPEQEAIVVSYPSEEPLDYAQLESIARLRLPADRPYVLLGESFSGPIAISIAASAPSGLRGLVLCASFVRNPRPLFSILRHLTGILPVRGVPSALLTRMLLGRFSSAARRAALARALARVSPAALRARVRAVLSVDVTPQLPHVRVPVLYLQAIEDHVVPRAAYRHISRLLPEIKVVELEAPHFLLQAAPAAAARQVRGFMQEVAQSRSNGVAESPDVIGGRQA